MSKAVPYLVLSLVNVTTILLLSVFVLDLPINGSLLLLFAESTLFIITCLSLGLIDLRQNAIAASSHAYFADGNVVTYNVFSGFMFPIENMPLPLQMISNIVPAKWFYIIVNPS